MKEESAGTWLMEVGVSCKHGDSVGEAAKTRHVRLGEEEMKGELTDEMKAGIFPSFSCPDHTRCRAVGNQGSVSLIAHTALPKAVHTWHVSKALFVHRGILLV